MLRLSSRLHESIVIETPAGDVKVLYMGLGQQGGHIALGIEAPREYYVHRDADTKNGEALAQPEPAVLGAMDLLGINPDDRDMVARMVIAYTACDGITNQELLRGRLVERFPELSPIAASNQAASTRTSAGAE